jgi:hypothetical protein
VGFERSNSEGWQAPAYRKNVEKKKTRTSDNQASKASPSQSSIKAPRHQAKQHNIIILQNHLKTSMSSIEAAQHHHPPKSPQASMDKNLQELGHHEQDLQHVASLLQDSKIIINGKSSKSKS